MIRTYLIPGLPHCQSIIPINHTWEKSIIWYCQQCGEVYARLPIDTKPNWWVSRPGCCSNCSPVSGLRMQIPGSVWSGYDAGYNWLLPKEVLEREFELAVKFYLEAQEDEQ